MQELDFRTIQQKSRSESFCNEDYLQWKADRYNAEQGDLQGYDCPKCKNRGYTMAIRNSDEVLAECECLRIRESLGYIRESGMSALVNRCTFESFDAKHDWQKGMVDKARKFLKTNDDGWLYLGGQVGSGKTHLCIAVAGKMMCSGKRVRYMLWLDEAVRLKASVTDEERYTSLINPFKNAEVLYIDDLFKSKTGTEPTAADIRVAFEIINHRYNDRHLRTIISSELSLDEICAIDDAVGSRIYERAKCYTVTLSEGANKNHRMKK